MKCPKCGSEQVVPILYEVTEYSEELKRRVINKEVYLARTNCREDQPEFHCLSCGKDVGFPPVLIGKRGRENYSDIVTSVRYYEEASLDPDELVIVANKKRGVKKLHVKPRFDEGNPINRELTESEWCRLVKSLYETARLHEWDKTYNNPEICVIDGVDWDLTIRFTDGRVRKYVSGNIDPPYWAELRSALYPFLKEAREALILELEKEKSGSKISKKDKEFLDTLLSDLKKKLEEDEEYD